MRRKEEKNTIIEICPVRNVIARFGNKWALLVILILSENKVLRFSELKKESKKACFQIQSAFLLDLYTTTS